MLMTIGRTYSATLAYFTCSRDRQERYREWFPNALIRQQSEIRI